MDSGWAMYEAMIDENGNVGPYFDRKPDFSHDPHAQAVYERLVQELAKRKHAADRSSPKKGPRA